ncbi:MAG: hypothetical protein WC781_04370 [Candidatus Pacearchaeota archaeon]|jgi:galactitol-specific phosphotransferase system IIB component
MSNPKIVTSFVLEILGRPAEYIIESIEQLIETMEKENGIKITQKTIHEPKKVEESKDLFTTFAEIEAEFDDFTSIINIIFKYPPSHFEIISPEEFRLKNSDISNLITAIILKLHRYDEIAKKITVDNAMLQNKLKEIEENEKSNK